MGSGHRRSTVYVTLARTLPKEAPEAFPSARPGPSTLRFLPSAVCLVARGPRNRPPSGGELMRPHAHQQRRAQTAGGSLARNCPSANSQLGVRLLRRLQHSYPCQKDRDPTPRAPGAFVANGQESEPPQYLDPRANTFATSPEAISEKGALPRIALKFFSKFGRNLVFSSCPSYGVVQNIAEFCLVG